MLGTSKCARLCLCCRGNNDLPATAPSRRCRQIFSEASMLRLYLRHLIGKQTMLSAYTLPVNRAEFCPLPGSQKAVAAAEATKYWLGCLSRSSHLCSSPCCALLCQFWPLPWEGWHLVLRLSARRIQLCCPREAFRYLVVSTYLGFLFLISLFSALHLLSTIMAILITTLKNLIHLC